MLVKRGERVRALQKTAQPDIPTADSPKSAAREIPEEDFRNRRFLNFPSGIPLKQIRKQA